MVKTNSATHKKHNSAAFGGPTICIAMLAVVICFVAAAGIVLYLWQSYKNANPDPSPRDGSSDAEKSLPNNTEAASETEKIEFPEVDWSYWQSVNPDIIGWITVPQTDINYPILQAHTENPDYYLTHDIYGQYNIFGCPYLDADNESEGLNSQNCIIYGHHINTGGMFSSFSDYLDLTYATKHATILLQGPDFKKVLHVCFCDVIDAEKEQKYTEFENAETFESWYISKRAGADVVLSTDTTPQKVYTFCTCSYNFWENERTLIYAAEHTI